MNVFILIEAGQGSPVVICRTVEKAMKPVPPEAQERKLVLKKAADYSHREIVGEWYYAKTGILFRVVCYTVL